MHDIEDLAKAGRDSCSCPYYASRHYASALRARLCVHGSINDTQQADRLASDACCAGEAELVFCPYSYLLDPVVRAAMEISLENAVLIFDEAHNIGEQPWQASGTLALAAVAGWLSWRVPAARRGPVQARHKWPAKPANERIRACPAA